MNELTNKELALLVTVIKLLGPREDETTINVMAIKDAYTENLKTVMALDPKRE